MSKKKTAGIITVFGIIILGVLAGLYFFVIKKGSINDYEMQRQGMKAWQSTEAPGILLYVPEDYELVQGEQMTKYVKDVKEVEDGKEYGAQVFLSSGQVDNDLANYAYNAVRQYEKVTDTFTIKEEFDEEVSNTTVHVVRFDYSLSLDDGPKFFSCLAAYAMGEGRSYVLTCVSDSVKFPEYEEDYRRIYKTMTLTETDKK